MRLIADFHLHSAYSRATSQDMHIRHLAWWAKLKGIDVLGTGDFTHSAYLEEIKAELEETGDGLLRLKGEAPGSCRFILTAETSHIYTQGGKGRRVHMMIFAPSLRTVERLNRHLGRIGNLKSDGRPIFGFSAKDLVKLVLDIDPDCLLVPAHVWTPWFSVFGSHSGFDRLEECFEEVTPQISVLETGLSSDPAMNRRWSALDRLSLISNSDAHSPNKIGREANILDCPLSYSDIIRTIREKDPQTFLATIEFFPEEGKYHYDGHRTCGVLCSPKETRERGMLCPICGKPLVVGVMHRVEHLSDREEGHEGEGFVPALHLVPLEEVLAQVYALGAQSRRVRNEYLRLVERGGSEFRILLDLEEAELRSFMDEDLVRAVLQVRKGRVRVRPGYDGVYGKVEILNEDPPALAAEQLRLF